MATSHDSRRRASGTIPHRIGFGTLEEQTLNYVDNGFVSDDDVDFGISFNNKTHHDNVVDHAYDHLSNRRDACFCPTCPQRTVAWLWIRHAVSIWRTANNVLDVDHGAHVVDDFDHDSAKYIDNDKWIVNANDGVKSTSRESGRPLQGARDR
ncbi:MAG TPA: hypothetical protein VGZ04_12320 [Acidimicrobiales bacterium]|nr:hypothetical protein [Acidimicrobiales bacterium]